MKRILFPVFFVLFVFPAFALGPLNLTNSLLVTAKGKGVLRNAHVKGQVAVHMGPGFISLQYPGHNDYLIYGQVVSEYGTPLNIGLGYAITSSIDAGIFINRFKSRTDIKDVTDNTNVNGFEYTSTSFLLTGAYHLYMGKNLVWLDPYVTGGVGYHALGAKDFGENNYFEPQKGGFAYMFNVGTNIYFFQPLGFYVEAGYGVNVVNVGLTLRF
jgi:hypothetical protein